MKLAIVGCRTFADYGLMIDFVENFVAQGNYRVDEIVSGGAQGADALAERLAEEYDIPTKIFPADWERYGKKAGYLRNEQIVQYCDCCIAFWDGKSRGTKLTIDLCARYGKPCHICRIE